MPEAILPALIGAGGSLLAGGQAAHAAEPAVQAQAGTAQAMTDVLNQLLSQYTQTYQPFENQMVQRMQGMVGGLPIEQALGQRLGELQQPYQMPEQIVNRMLLGQQGQTDRESAMAQREMAQRGLTGSGIEQAMLARLGEAGLQAKHGIFSDIGLGEAQQTEAQRGEALKMMLGLMGTGMQTAQSGRQMVPGIMSGMQNMMQMYGQAGQQAAMPWNQFAAGIPGMVGQYYQSQAYRQPTGYTQDPYSMYPIVGGSMNNVPPPSYNWNPNQ